MREVTVRKSNWKKRERGKKPLSFSGNLPQLSEEKAVRREEGMVVEIICVGTELLLGNIVNTNAAYLAERCANLGLHCYYQTVVGDNEERLLETIKTGMNRSDILILSGGLGPTKDDLTKECVAKAVNRDLVRDEHSAKRIAAYFEKRGMEITENNWKQAEIPEGARAVDNDNGTAPGIIVEAMGKKIILLPGPPMELKPMFEEKMMPYLRSLQPGIIYSKTVKLCGIGESKAETMILDLIGEQGNPTIAPYAKTGEVHFRITAKAETKEEALDLMQPMLLTLKQRFGTKIYSMEEKETLESTVISILRDKELKLAVAESCTGGLLAGRITAVSGASEVFGTGLVTYSNKAKKKLLGVKKTTLKEFGAVSRETAKEMAYGICKEQKTQVGLSVTGIAGPSGGSEEKPVGLVYIGCNVCGKIVVKEFHFSGNREKIRQSSVTSALILLRKCLLEFLEEDTLQEKENPIK